MKVRELTELLSKENPEGEVLVAVGWAKDTAISDEGGDLEVVSSANSCMIQGWLSNCGTELQMGPDAGDEGNNNLAAIASRVAAQRVASGPAPETEQPKCEECKRPLTEQDQRSYEAEGGEGYPAVCEDCAEVP